METIKQTQSSFKSLLESEYLRRLRKNPKYSIRAFARSLDMNDSTLSQILRGKRNISPKKVTDVGLKLGLSLSEINSFHEVQFTESLPSNLKFKELEEDK